MTQPQKKNRPDYELISKRCITLHGLSVKISGGPCSSFPYSTFTRWGICRKLQFFGCHEYVCLLLAEVCDLFLNDMKNEQREVRVIR